jgi:hypothetical protein
MGEMIFMDNSGNTHLDLDGLIIQKDPSGGAIDYSVIKNKPVIREADLKVQVPVGTILPYVGNDYIEDTTFVKAGTIVNRNDYIELANTIGIPKSQTTFTIPYAPSDWNSIVNNPFTNNNSVLSTNSLWTSTLTVNNTTNETALTVNQASNGDVVDFRYRDYSILKIADGGNVGIGSNLDVTGNISGNQITGNTMYTNNLSIKDTSGTILVPSNTRLGGFSVGAFYAPYSVVQIRNISTMPTSHLSTIVTTFQYAPLISSITPVFTNSRIKVEFFSTMALGSQGSWMVLVLERCIAGGAFVDLTPFSNAGTRYYYGWGYYSSSWGPLNYTYYDTPNTTNVVTYRVKYRNANTAATNYLVHQHMEYGWTLTEIKQPS